ncbi:MAG: DUF945 family protein [Gammaproteobacteria bacterium]
MKRRIGISLAIIIAIIVIAAAVAPYFVGRAAESNFKSRIAYINSHHTGYVVQVDSYRRGFYSSEAVLSVTPQASMAPRAMQMWSIFLGSRGNPQFDLRINHGPITFAAFGSGHVNFMPVLYSAEFKGAKLPPASIVGIFKPDVYIRQFFGGSIHSTLSVPPGRYSLGVFGATWQGAQMTAQTNGAQDHVRFSGSIAPIQYQAQNPKSGKSYSGTLQGFTFSGDTRRAKYDFWTGTNQATFKGAEFKVNGKQIAKLAAGESHGETDESADGHWGGSSVSTQQGGTIKGWQYSKLTLNEKVSHIDAAAMRQFFDQLNAVAKSTGVDAGKDAVKGTLPVLGRALASAQATASLGLAAPDGRLDVGARVTFDATPPAATASGTAELLERINARVTVDFNRKLVDGFNTQVLGGANAAQIVDHVLDQWQKQGYLKTGSDGREHSVLTYRAGVFSINGHLVSDESAKPQAKQ